MLDTEQSDVLSIDGPVPVIPAVLKPLFTRDSEDIFKSTRHRRITRDEPRFRETGHSIPIFCIGVWRDGRLCLLKKSLL
ncbi:MAG: hypothetical protein IJH79_11460 [Lentisphaeria bacterium]|nr:hypothetical protein [Lentisphaeria bacterium]